MPLPPVAVVSGWTPILDRCRFVLSGSDRTRYLNGQVTNQIANLPADTTRYACVTNRKGQLEADLFVSAWPEQGWLMLEAPASVREELFTRLDRYIIADDAELEDVTDTWRTFHVLPNPATPLAPLPPNHQTSNNRFGIVGIDFVVSASESAAFEQALSESLGLPLEPEVLDYCRVRRGIPKWEAELTPGLLPPEARLEKRAIDYSKGCYIGQEVISRIKSAGKVNRRLCLFRIDPSHPIPHAGDAIVTDHEPPKTIGQLTTVMTPSEAIGLDAECLALGYLKSQHISENTAFATQSDAGNRQRSIIILQPFPNQDS